MELKTFIQKHRDQWNRLEQSLQEVTKGGRAKNPEKLEQFLSSYQKVSHHLSFCQTYYPNEEITTYLNELVGKAHAILYRDQVNSSQQIKTFFGQTFIRLLIEQWKFVALAFVLFLVGGLGGFLAIINNPLNLYSVLPIEMANAIDPSQLGKNTENIDSPLMSTQIMTNNIQVALLAFASGITFGIGTIYLLIYNGIIIGALAAVFWQHDKFYDFWAFIVPHGIIELTAIFIAGGAGLLMGYRLLVPGSFSRIFQLKKQSLRSVQLLLGTLPLFIIAGIIEGYITPAPISLEWKYGVALITLFALIFYIGWGSLSLRRKKTTALPD